MKSLPKAALFDLDGVVIDTESQYSLFWGSIGRQYLPDVPDFAERIKGTTLESIYANWFAHLEDKHAEITHKLNEIMAVSDRVTVLRTGKYIGTVETKNTNKQELSSMMVGRPVQLEVNKTEAKPTETVLSVENFCVPSALSKKNAVNNVSFNVRAGEIVCIAGIDGNGQTELVYGLSGLEKSNGGKVTLCGTDISKASIKTRGSNMSHIPEDRHKHGLVLDFTLEQNMVLQRYNEPQFQKMGFIKNEAVREYSDALIEQYDVRSGQGSITVARSMSGGNQQKAIIARELDRDKSLSLIHI